MLSACREQSLSGAVAHQSSDTQMTDAQPVATPSQAPDSFEQHRKAWNRLPQSQAAGISGDYLRKVLMDLGGGSHSTSSMLPSLSHVLQAKNLVPLLQEPSVQRRLKELVEYLPSEEQAEARQDVRPSFSYYNSSQ